MGAREPSSKQWASVLTNAKGGGLVGGGDSVVLGQPRRHGGALQVADHLVQAAAHRHAPGLVAQTEHPAEPLVTPEVVACGKKGEAG